MTKLKINQKVIIYLTLTKLIKKEIKVLHNNIQIKIFRIYKIIGMQEIIILVL
jgi:hypothetical protein